MTNANIATTETRGRGRPSIFDNRDVQFAALIAIRDKAENQPSRFLKIKMQEAGLVQVVTEIKTGGRGRPAFVYGITDAAKAFIRKVNASSASKASAAKRAAARAEAEAASAA